MKKKLLFVLVLFLHPPCAKAQSFLDSTFGTNGIVITYDGTSTNDRFNAIVIQPNNKIIGAGFAIGRVVVARYNENGTLDNTFATGGIFSGQDNTTANALLLQPNGKIITAGVGPLYRLNADGSLDNTFGNGGLDTLEPPLDVLGRYALTLQPDGKILIAGTANGTSIGIGRLLPNGITDSTFGVNGLVATNTWSTWAYGQATGIAVMPNGSIVVGGVTSLNGFIAIRLLPDGPPDTSFNHTGVAITVAGGSFNYCHAMVLQPDGKIVLGGSGFFGANGSDFTLVRYNTDGSLDRSYGDTGVVNIDFNRNDDVIGALCPAQNEAIIAAGYAVVAGHENFALARIDSNGKVDSIFGNNGRITTAIQDSNDLALGVVIQQDDKIILAGSSEDASGYNGDLTLARYISFPAANVSNLMLPTKVFLYPNPTVSLLMVNNTNHIIDIAAHDMLGNEIAIDFRPFDKTIVCYNFICGYYFFTISFDDRPPIVQKILIRNN